MDSSGVGVSARDQCRDVPLDAAQQREMGGTHLPGRRHHCENCSSSSRVTVVAQPVGAVPEHDRPVILKTNRRRQPVIESDQVGNDPEPTQTAQR